MDEFVRRDIDGAVSRVLETLGAPAPPLDLTVVREALQLERLSGAASLKDAGGSAVFVGSQLHEACTIPEVVRKSGLQALYLPDRRAIWLNDQIPEIKHRWNEAHEIGHSIIPWHARMTFGDNEQTLTRACYERLEEEANYAAGRLLFLEDQFAMHVEAVGSSFKSVQQLSRDFGNSITSTLWRLVEDVQAALPKFGLISEHPNRIGRNDFGPREKVHHYLASSSFRRQFRSIGPNQILNEVVRYCGTAGKGPIGAEEIMLPDDNSNLHLFRCETFFNGYEALTLGIWQREYKLSIHF